MNTAIVITLALAVAVTYASPAASKDVRQTSSESVPKVRSRDAHSLVRRATHMKYADAPQDSSTAITQQKDIVSDLLEGVFDNDKRGLFTSDSDNSNFMWKSITWVIKRLLDRSPIGAIIDNFIRGKDENQEEEEEEEEKEKGSFGTRQQVIHVNGWPPEDKKYFQIHVNGWPPEDGKSKNCTAKKWKRREIFDQRWNFQNRKMYGLGMGGSPFHPGMPVGGFPGQMMPPGAVPVVDTPQLQNPAGFPMGMFQQPMMGNPMLLHPGQEGLGQLNQMLPQLQAQQQQSKLQAQVQQLQLQAQSQQPQLQTQLQAQLQALLQEPLIQALLRQPQLQALLQPSCLNLSKQPDIHLNIDQKWLAAVNKLVAENKDDKKPEVKEKKDEKKDETKQPPFTPTPPPPSTTQSSPSSTTESANRVKNKPEEKDTPSTNMKPSDELKASVEPTHRNIGLEAPQLSLPVKKRGFSRSIPKRMRKRVKVVKEANKTNKKNTRVSSRPPSILLLRILDNAINDADEEWNARRFSYDVENALEKSSPAIPRDPLLDELYQDGIRGPLPFLVRSNPRNSKHRTNPRTNRLRKPSIEPNDDVQQTSILGPTLFILRINDSPATGRKFDRLRNNKMEEFEGEIPKFLLRPRSSRVGEAAERSPGWPFASNMIYWSVHIDQS